jgi:hypothetical protein
MKLKNSTNHPGKNPAGTNPVAEYRQRKLKRHIRFTDAELDANRRGQLSDGGQRKLRWNLRWHIVSRSILIMVCCLFCGWLIAVLPASNDGIISGLLLIFLIFGVGWIILLAESSYSLWRKTRADLQQGNVSRVTGKISRYAYPNPRLPFYVFRIYFEQHNGKPLPFSLNCSLWVYMGFADNSVYHVFYAPNTQTIISAEFVRDITHKIEKRYISGAD